MRPRSPTEDQPVLKRRRSGLTIDRKGDEPEFVEPPTTTMIATDAKRAELPLIAETNSVRMRIISINMQNQTKRKHILQDLQNVLNRFEEIKQDRLLVLQEIGNYIRQVKELAFDKGMDVFCKQPETSDFYCNVIIIWKPTTTNNFTVDVTDNEGWTDSNHNEKAGRFVDCRVTVERPTDEKKVSFHMTGLHACKPGDYKTYAGYIVDNCRLKRNEPQITVGDMNLPVEFLRSELPSHVHAFPTSYGVSFAKVFRDAGFNDRSIRQIAEFAGCDVALPTIIGLLDYVTSGSVMLDFGTANDAFLRRTSEIRCLLADADYDCVGKSDHLPIAFQFTLNFE